ncbi:MAG TPA: hypothetical protein VM182_13205 [Terriglobia bacterium]|nr:hypothetical protein [Terriglobia bacterium]
MSNWTARIERWAVEAAPEFHWSALRRSLEQLSFRAVPHLATAALGMDAGGLKSAGPPRLFSANLRRIDPTLNDDLLELYGRSEQALANRFSFLNIDEDFGREIGWEVQTAGHRPALQQNRHGRR